MSQESNKDLSEILKWIAAILGAMLVIFGFLEKVTGGGELSAPILAGVTGLVLTGLLVYSGKLQGLVAAVAWLAAALVISVIYTIISQPVTVAGTIIDSNGIPVAGSTLTLTDADGVAHNTVTDENGGFEVRNVPQGKYTILANNKLVFSGDVSSGWQRIFAPEVDAGRIVSIDTAQLPTNTPVPQPITPTLDNTPTIEPTNTFTLTSTITATQSDTPTTTPTHTTRPSQTPSPTSSATPFPATIPDEMILFREDFENETDDGFIVLRGNWQIEKDETGNHYYQSTGSNGTWPVTLFGASDLKGYVVELDIRITEKPDTNNLLLMIWFLRTIATGGEQFYATGFNSERDISLFYISSGDQWRYLTKYEPFQVIENTWYRLRINIYDTTIQISIDDVILLEYPNTRLFSGGLALNVGLNTTAQFDNILVWRIDNDQ